METIRERKSFGTLSALAATAVLVLAGSGAVWAQTTTLHAPTSGLRPTNVPANPPTNSMGSNAQLTAPAAHLAAPAALTAAPAGATLTAKVGAISTKKYALKAQVVPGAALNAQQKLATAMAALAENERQAKEQQDKKTEAKIAQLKSTLSIGNSATLSLLSPKSPIGNAVLSISMANSVSFERNQAQFNAGTLKDYGNLIGWPAAYCYFKAPEDGFYMVAYTVENFPNVGGTTTVTAGINHVGLWNPENEAKATLNKGVSIVAVVQEFRKGEDATSRITSAGIFGFNSCEISRLK